MKPIVTLVAVLPTVLVKAVAIPAENEGIAGHDLEARSTGSEYARDDVPKVHWGRPHIHAQSNPARTVLSFTYRYEAIRIQLSSSVFSASQLSESHHGEALSSPTHVPKTQREVAAPTSPTEKHHTIPDVKVAELKAQSTGLTCVREEGSINKDQHKGSVPWDASSEPDAALKPTRHTVPNVHFELKARGVGSDVNVRLKTRSTRPVKCRNLGLQAQPVQVGSKGTEEKPHHQPSSETIHVPATQHERRSLFEVDAAGLETGSTGSLHTRTVPGFPSTSPHLDLESAVKPKPHPSFSRVKGPLGPGATYSIHPARDRLFQSRLATKRKPKLLRTLSPLRTESQTSTPEGTARDEFVLSKLSRRSVSGLDSAGLKARSTGPAKCAYPRLQSRSPKPSPTPLPASGSGSGRSNRSIAYGSASPNSQAEEIPMYRTRKAAIPKSNSHPENMNSMDRACYFPVGPHGFQHAKAGESDTANWHGTGNVIPFSGSGVRERKPLDTSKKSDVLIKEAQTKAAKKKASEKWRKSLGSGSGFGHNPSLLARLPGVRTTKEDEWGTYHGQSRTFFPHTEHLKNPSAHTGVGIWQPRGENPYDTKSEGKKPVTLSGLKRSGDKSGSASTPAKTTRGP